MLTAAVWASAVNCVSSRATSATGSSAYVRVGSAANTLNDCATEGPPPGPGLTTVTATVLAELMSPAAIWAVSWVLLTNVVGRATPFHWTIEVLRKFVPVTVSGKAIPPAATLVGASAVIAGTGLFPAGFTVNGLAADEPPPGAGVKTVTCAAVTVVTSLAGSCAVRRVAETNVVARPVPFHRTTELPTNPAPITVSVWAPAPTVTLAGEIELTAGTTLFTAIDKLPPCLRRSR